MRLASVLAVAGMVAATVLGETTTASATTASLPGYYTWVNAKTVDTADNKCLAVSGGIMTPGRGAIQWHCNGGLEQQWSELDLSGAQVYSKLRSAKDPNYCLSVPNNTSEPGVQLIIWPCGNGPEQLWDPVPVRLSHGTGWLLRNKGTGMYAASYRGETGDNVPVIQWNATGDLGQYWY